MLRFTPLLLSGLTFFFFKTPVGLTAPPSSTPSEVKPVPIASQAVPLQLLTPKQIPRELGFDERIWGRPGQWGNRSNLLLAIDRSLQYLQTSKAAADYRQYPIPGITQKRVQRSLERFRSLVLQARSPAELQNAVKREFVFYRSIGQDGQGTVMYTGYFEPVYSASRTRTAEHRYPLYRVPSDLDRWSKPHPTRLQLEGADGLQGHKGRLKGLELVWLRDRFEAFLVHVQGSARLQLQDGNFMTVGYAGRTDYPYTGVGKELVKDGRLQREGLTLASLKKYFQKYPSDLNRYLPRNQSFIFFKDTNGQPATGSLTVPVTAERSIATDKSLMPPGALALVYTQIPYRVQGKLKPQQVSRFMLDQDTGSAIRGAGRVDIFMGTGAEAGERAGVINHSGQLYYLLLKE